jgi:hypothetical protein
MVMLGLSTLRVEPYKQLETDLEAFKRQALYMFLLEKARVFILGSLSRYSYFCKVKLG